jgi:hypothetical protein
MSTSMRGTTDPELADLHEHVERWVAESLISRAEGRAIERYESERAPTTARSPLAVEALAYLGGALALAAAVVAGSGVWDDLAPGVRVGLLAAGSILSLGAGWWLRGSSEPAIDRLIGVLWGMAVALAGACGAVAAHDLMELGDQGTATVAGATATALALALYAIRRRTIQQLAVLVGLLITLNQAVDSEFAHALLTTGVGAVWAILGWRGLLAPVRPAIVFGSLVAMIGAMSGGEDERAITFALALAVSISLIVASIALREGVVLAIGVVGLFQASVRTIDHYFAGSVAMPVALLIAGGVAFGAAMLLARRTPKQRSGPPIGTPRHPARKGRGPDRPQDVPL